MSCPLHEKLLFLTMTVVGLLIFVPQIGANPFPGLSVSGSVYSQSNIGDNSSSPAHQNVTIDDTMGDPTNNNHFSYLPSTAWKQGNGCSHCTAQPNPAQAKDKTWHDSTFRPTGDPNGTTDGQINVASVQFTGSAVYVYCILTRHTSLPDGNTDMTFFIDNEKVGIFSQTTNGDPSFQYNALVYMNASLENVQHTFRLESGHAGQQALVLLDYLIYTTMQTLNSPISPSNNMTTENGSNATSSSSRSIEFAPAATAGGAIGGAAFVFLCFGIYLLLVRRRRKIGFSQGVLR